MLVKAQLLFCFLLLLLWVCDCHFTSEYLNYTVDGTFRDETGSRGRRLKNRDGDLQVISKLVPLREDADSVMFWRLQKVGSSTILSILMSYAYRYNHLPRRKGMQNQFCRKIAECALHSSGKLSKKAEESVKKHTENKKYAYMKAKSSEYKSIPFKLSLTHELCNIDAATTHSNMRCAFNHESWIQPTPVTNFSDSPFKLKELFLVREPLSRVVSVYYFWGELHKIKLASRSKINRQGRDSKKRVNTDKAKGRNESRKLGSSSSGGRISTSSSSGGSGSSSSGGSGSSSSGGSGSSSSGGSSNTYRGSEQEHVDDYDDYDDYDEYDEYDHDDNLSGTDSYNAYEHVDEHRHQHQHLQRRTYGLLSHLMDLFKLFLPGSDNSLPDHTAPYEAESNKRILQSTEQRQGRRRQKSNFIPKLGATHNFSVKQPIKSKTLVYHGDETSSPSYEIAMQYANRLPYTAGMPGPSLSWSAFSSSVDDALEVMQSDRLMTIVIERLPESLVVASHYLGWTLADVVVTVPRKALSVHPKPKDWPSSATDRLRDRLEHLGEYKIYNAAVAKLDERIQALEKIGVRVSKEVEKLQSLQERVTSVCLNHTHLAVYRNMLAKAGYPLHFAKNKLRDVPEKYFEDGHLFSFNREILCSFDICGSCEAHAILYAIQTGLAHTIDDAPLLVELINNSEHGDKLASNINFAKCPTKELYGDKSIQQEIIN